jgi:hypothetical protein
VISRCVVLISQNCCTPYMFAPLKKIGQLPCLPVRLHARTRTRGLATCPIAPCMHAAKASRPPVLAQIGPMPLRSPLLSLQVEQSRLCSFVRPPCAIIVAGKVLRLQLDSATIHVLPLNPLELPLPSLAPAGCSVHRSRSSGGLQIHRAAEDHLRLLLRPFQPSEWNPR